MVELDDNPQSMCIIMTNNAQSGCVIMTDNAQVVRVIIITKSITLAALL